MTWQKPFDRLLKAMSQGEPHKAEKRSEKQKADSDTNRKSADDH